MVELPGSLERATLGDILGALHRDRVSGALCLEELGRVYHRHVIHWHEGLIHHVETTRQVDLTRAASEAHPAGAERWFSRGVGADRLRLEALFELTRAKLSFRVMGRRPVTTEKPLEPAEFLHGRRRKRDTGETPTPRAVVVEDDPRQTALRSLGLSGNPGPDAVRAAFRTLARRFHPDLHVRADEGTRTACARRFTEISSAYQALMAR